MNLYDLDEMTGALPAKGTRTQETVACCEKCGQKLPLTLGDRVRAARIVKGWTALALSEQMELTPDYITHIELGKRRPSLRVLHGLAIKLGVSMDWLLGS